MSVSPGDSLQASFDKVTTPPIEASVRTFLARFTEPDPHFSPVPLWWWSGEPLSIEKLRWQMDRMREMGIHNVCVINLAPNGTQFGCDADDPPFLSERWWVLFAEVCAYAKSIGMFVWFYDQIGFSGASYQANLVAQQPDFLAHQLKSVFIEGQGGLAVECPKTGTPIAAYVVPLDSTNGPMYIDRIERRVGVNVDRPSRLRLVYATRQGYDYFSPAACDKLLETVHREFERRLPEFLGSTIVGSFQDELPDLPTWGHLFAQEFAGVIHYLFEEGGEAARQTRLRYHRFRATLAEAALFKPFFDWHAARGLQCGFDQQSPAREARVVGTVAKYADYIQTHRWYTIPGSDLHGNGKLHSSIAFLYDRPRVWLEGFHSTGWGGTIADTFDWMLPYLQSGVTLFNPHAVYYSTRMGWWEWAPPSTCWRQPYARHYSHLANMVARICKLFAQGIHQATIGVLFPSSTVQASLGIEGAFDDARQADQTLHEVLGSMRWHQAQTGALDEAAIDFHLLDESSIAGSQVLDAGMVIKGVALQAIVLPHVTMIDDAALDRLIEFAAKGGIVFCINATSLCTPTGRTVDLKEDLHARLIQSASELRRALEAVQCRVQSAVPFLHRVIEEIHLLFVPAVAGMATVVKWPSWFEPMEQTTIDVERYESSIELKLPTDAKSVWRFDPTDGSIHTVPNSRKLDFDGAPFAILAWSSEPGSVAEESDTPDVVIENVPMAAEWQCRYEPTLPTDFADIYDPRRAELRWPHTAEFRWRRQSTGEESDVCATFGPRAWSGDGKPICYSPMFGIDHDKTHILTLGPKGHVPEEFIDCGKLKAGQAFVLGTGVIWEFSEQDALLVIGGNAQKSARINGQHFVDAHEDYQWIVPIALQRGINSIELEFKAQRDGMVRAYWCIARRGAESLLQIPERIAPGSECRPGSKLIYLAQFDVPGDDFSGEVKVATVGSCIIRLDGRTLGQQGGFDPYHPQMRGQLYRVEAINPGKHELSIEMIETPGGAPLRVDLLLTGARGRRVVLRSDADWTVARDDDPPRPVKIHLRQEEAAASWMLFRRPHPLPQTRWLEGDKPSPIMDLRLIPPLEIAEAQTFTWVVPPGAVALHLMLESEAKPILLLDGDPCLVDAAGWATLSGVLPSRARTAELTVQSRQLGGGVFTGPVTYRFDDAGILRSGNWIEQGLRSYSGAIRLSQHFSIGRIDRGSILLDLGEVRGTVEARVNGKPAGVRVLSPYTFDVSELVRAGENELELIVTNTLSNFLSTWSPTTWWSPDQLSFGVYGPTNLQRISLKDRPSS